MADPDYNPPGPLSWVEAWRASAFRFTRYRTERQGPVTQEDYNRDRARWMNMRPYNIPPQDIFREQIARFPFTLLSRRSRNQRLDGPMPANPTQAHEDARARLHAVQYYFSTEPNWQYRRSLGYREGRLQLLYKYRPWPPFNFIVKVDLGLDNWESSGIRREGKILKDLEKSAHIVQAVPPDRVQLPALVPYEYELVPSDDSSEEGESSGSESREDEPDPADRDNRTRRQIQAQNPEAARQKAYRHERRMRAARRARSSRLDHIRRLRERDARLANQGREVPLRVDIHDERRVDYLLLEDFHHGDLESLVFRLVEDNTRIPNTVLWSFFLCLIRACVAMQYPVRKFDPRRRDAPAPRLEGMRDIRWRGNNANAASDLLENAPEPRKQWAGKRLVHFNIELSNIFMTDIDPRTRNNEHRIVPGLKLGNFSSAQEVKPKKRNAYYTKMRDRGEFGYYAPEQFGIDWNYIAKPDGTEVDHDGPEISEEGIAGNYGPWTNVWGIGLVMWQLMTLQKVKVPPQPQRGQDIAEFFPDYYAPYILTRHEYDPYDLELRVLIAWCLSADPRSRPEPSRLLDMAKFGVDKRFEGEDDNVVGSWVNTFIYSPAANRPQ